MTRLTLAVLVASCTLLVAAAQAEPVVRARRQQARINQGVRSGAVTPEERAALRAGQRKLRQDRHDALKDRHVTLDEAAKLRAERNKASRDIARAKHNRVVR